MHHDRRGRSSDGTSATNPRHRPRHEGVAPMKLTDFKALTFDCYGALIDWESGMVEALKPLTSRVGREPSRNEILEAHARHESSQQLQTPGEAYRDLLPIVYKRLAEEWGASAPWEECVAYGCSVRNWPAFVDSAGALQYLKKHFKLIILSNVDKRELRRQQQEASGGVRCDLHSGGR